MIRKISQLKRKKLKCKEENYKKFITGFFLNKKFFDFT